MKTVKKLLEVQLVDSPALNTHLRPNPKKKHGVWDPMPELTITSPYVHSRVDSNTFSMGKPMPDFRFGLCYKVELIEQEKVKQYFFSSL